MFEVSKHCEKKDFTKMRRKITAFCLCFLFPSVLSACTVKVKEDDQKSNLTQEQIEENYQKLCKVWGYVKYTHPVFLSGEKDWDEQLLALIDQTEDVSDEAAMNCLLNDWLEGLGTVEERDSWSTSSWERYPEDKKMYLADTAWMEDEEYLGEELSEQLLQLQDAETQDENGPVMYTVSAPDFSNEKTYENMDYAETGYRLLGVFRLWNAIEYYYPYRDLMDEDWNDVLEESIEQVLADTDRHSYELTIASMAAKLHDAHTQFLDTGYLKEEFGEYTLPVNFILSEGQIVVKEVFDRSSLTSDKAAEDIPCQLQRGDVLLRINGEDIWEIIQKKEEYVSVPQDDKIMNTMTSDLIRSKDPEITVTVLRQGQEITITDSGMEMVSINALTPPDQSHELLD